LIFLSEMHYSSVKNLLTREDKDGPRADADEAKRRQGMDAASTGLEETLMPTLNDLVEKIKKETDTSRVGMIACHNGVVRGTSRAGEPAEYLDIELEGEAWDQVLGEMRSKPGIAAVEAYLFTGRRYVGDDVLLIAVAGDIRENVLPVLELTLNRLKKEGVKKREKLR
jgi:molybdopterin synthase catalytic subunit